jgi:ABC-type antimicrobial peptide transport system permease subunit
MLPLLFWFLISGRRGAWKTLDVIFFLLGGLVVYVLFYFFGYVVLHIDLAVLWYLMMMFSIRMVSFPTALVITAIIAAGLMMIIKLPRVRRPA